jgi:hypothetical protein
MTYRIQRVSYFYATIEDEPGAACAVLTPLAELGVNLVALNAVPLGPTRTQLSLFPQDDASMEKVAGDAGMKLDGPHPAILVQGDDEIGALASVHQKLGAAKVNVFASTCVANGEGAFGYVVYVRPKEIDRALAALQTT